MFNYITNREEFEGYTGQLFAMIVGESWCPKIHSIYPLEQAAKAHEDLESRQTTGKLLLDTLLAGERGP